FQRTASETLAAAEAPTEPASAAVKLGEILVEIGVISPDQLRRAQRIQQRLPNATTLITVLEELRLIMRDQVREALKARRQRIPIPLGAFLVELAYIREHDLRLALSVQKKRPNQGIGAILVESHALTEDQLVEVLSIQLGVERLFPRNATIDPNLWQESKWLRQYQLIPIGRRDGVAVVALADPLNAKYVEAARKVFGRDVIIGIAAPTEIYETINRLNAQKRKAATVGENDAVEIVNQI